ncbi:ribonucleotide-diphosphate reductase subunit alpha [Carboxydothermus islandicus]|uniref:Vitamin B12-dependent ribonucleotide reductase n=1 Tax=Carboxydothermus islandicus TaxID=661089 RepID=A0A1L8D5R8_9THEO|nr:vitamin B12-dependent ribonucleotide reductase [Carboxydothermus islandicus]GAV26523.1 ribonucleotide-diphosphate reductase subunit alpha [Carboxydothermus islandicus]
MKLTENALKVLEARYLARNEKGEVIETPEQMFWRVARAIAEAEKIYDKEADVEKIAQEFYNFMTELDFLPNTPTLVNAGRPLGQLSACFVLPVGDSMEDIFDAVKYSALIHKSGGGTGFSFSRLRAKGARVRSTGGIASGPVSFMKVFNAATEAVKQGGVRRGANMGVLRCDHPDILEFITAKEDNKDITNFNISVALTDKFMKALEEDGEYELIEPSTGEVVGKLRAREVFERIAKNAWKNGEPGVIFIDRINEANVVPELGEIESTNPCGEQPLLPYESCNLGSINLANMVKDGEIDWEHLEKTVKLAVRFLDNVIDVNHYPLPEIEKMTKKTRKIGLGVMGFADMLIKLSVPYDSEEALNLADKVMEFINKKSKEASAELARVRGTFPAWKKSVWAKKGLKLRNATTTTIAPTGSISIIAGVSSGIEPVFALAFKRHILDRKDIVEVHRLFEQHARENGYYSEKLMMEVAKTGRISGIAGVPEEAKRLFVTALDIAPEWHVKMQAVFQKHTDNAVSKTINMPNSATVEDVKESYLLAYKLGCKGLTVYRDGSREEQVLNVGLTETKKDEKPEELKTKTYKVVPRPRPTVTYGVTEKVKIGCGNLYITVNRDEEGICEVFTNLGRAGGCPSQSEATSRLVSLALRSGIDVTEIIGQLKGIRCHSTLRQMGNGKDIKVLSCPDAIGKAMEKVLKDAYGFKGKIEVEAPPVVISNEGEVYIPEEEGERKNGYCPECHSKLEHEGGCVVCRNCGYSKCG